MSLPEHVAIILDGNGRWAKKRGMPRTYGHTAGARNVETIIRTAGEIGIHYLTLYAFSTENWKRPREEVLTIMKLLDRYLVKCVKDAAENNMRVRIIGRRTELTEELRADIEHLEESSRDNTGLFLQIAINYGGRDEIVRAAGKAMQILKESGKGPEDLSEQLLSDCLDTRDVPDPDLLIRTSGEMRLSNYLIWQLAYTELYFTPVPWPDFTPEEFRKALAEYEQRHRRFGGV